VPLHRARLVERGYNQAALLARELARLTGGRFVPRALVRLRMTEQQARLGRMEREANVRNAFGVVEANVPQRAILVDDVVTTGETARACLKTLQGAGSAVLGVVALARAGKAPCN
jgi:predicted amidophosphoribosyltransferase